MGSGRTGRGGVSSELKLFEDLESFTNNESFCSKASFVQNFLQRDLDLNNTQQSVLNETGEITEEDEEVHELSLLSASLMTTSDCDTSYASVCVENEEEVGKVEESSGKREREVRPPTSRLLGKGRDALLSLLLQKYGGSKDVQVLEDGDEELSVVVEEEEERSVIVEEDDNQKFTGDDDNDESVIEEDNNQKFTGDDDNDESVIEEDDDKNYTDDDDDGSIIAEDKEKEDDMGIKNWTQYFELMDLKRSLQDQQLQLAKEKESFVKVRSAEEARMKGEKKRVESQKKSLQTLIADYDKIKFSKKEYEEKIKSLSDQLREAKLQMNKRITRWSDQQRRLEERVKTLEKENEELKKSLPRSIPQRLAALKRPPMRCVTNGKKQQQQKPSPNPQQLQRRVQFADDCVKDEEGEEEKENDSSKISKNSSSSFFIDDSVASPEKDEGTAGQQADKDSNDQLAKEIHLSDDEADKTMPADYVEVRHPCGTVTRVTKDNKLTRHILINNDVMDEHEDCSVRYYYRELGFAQTTYPNGDEIIEYDSGEIETRRADGSKIYTYADGLVKMVDGASGSEEVIFGDGSVVRKTTNGEMTITWPSGQKEVRTDTYVKRIYTNGTVKIMYKDGSEETRYFNGRIRRKDKNGVLVDDTKKAKQ